MNRNTTIVLVVIFAVLVLYVLTVQLPNERAANATPTPVAASSAVWTIAGDQIAGVRVVDRAGNRSVAFAKDGQGIWSVTEPEAQPADQSLASTSAARFTNLFATRTITTPADMGPFGVLSPTYTVELKLVDGTQLSVAIGDKTPTGSAYYLLRRGEADVIVVSSSGIDGIISLLDEPPYLAPIATVGPTVDFAATLFAPGATTGASATAPSATAPAATQPSAATPSATP